MASEIALSSAARSALLSLKSASDLINRTNNRLSSGLKVASPIDDAKVFFEAKALNDRAADISEKKDGVDQAISSVSAALEAVESIDSLVRQAKGIAVSAKTATGSELTSLISQYNEVRSQIDNLAADASYQGLNLINGTGETLTVSFSTDTASVLEIDSIDLRVGSLGLAIASAANFSLTSNIDASLSAIGDAAQRLRGLSQSLGSNVAILQTRLDFTSKYVNALEDGAGKLTLADITEEGANLVALQTRQQLGINALAFAGQSEQAILSLFR